MGDLTPLDHAMENRRRLAMTPEEQSINQRIRELLVAAGGFRTDPITLLNQAAENVQLRTLRTQDAARIKELEIKIRQLQVEG